MLTAAPPTALETVPQPRPPRRQPPSHLRKRRGAAHAARLRECGRFEEAES